MPDRTDYQSAGMTTEGKSVVFSIEEDAAVVIRTEQGARLRVRPVIVDVMRRPPETEGGRPVYGVLSFVHVSVVEPEPSGEGGDGSL
jgi:hypothetical protein